MNNVVTTLTLLCYSATCLRLLLYRRGLANYRFKIALLAWCLILFTGSRALELLLHPHPVILSDASLAALLFVLVWRARGNVASITRGLL